MLGKKKNVFEEKPTCAMFEGEEAFTVDDPKGHVDEHAKQPVDTP